MLTVLEVTKILSKCVQIHGLTKEAQSQITHWTIPEQVILDLQADASREPLEVLRKVLDAYWINCYSDDEREAIRQRAEALLAGEPAPERTEPTPLEVAEAVREACAKLYCDNCYRGNMPSLDRKHNRWMHQDTSCGGNRMRLMPLAPILKKLGPGSTPEPAAGGSTGD